MKIASAIFIRGACELRVIMSVSFEPPMNVVWSSIKCENGGVIFIGKELPVHDFVKTHGVSGAVISPGEEELRERISNFN